MTIPSDSARREREIEAMVEQAVAWKPTGQHLNTTRSQLYGIAREAIRLALAHERQRQVEGCPCVYTTPCRELCACVKDHSSMACLRCCKYGSFNQRKKRAELIAKLLERTTP